MPNIHLNNNNHLAIANPTPTPIHQYTRAVVGEYNTTIENFYDDYGQRAYVTTAGADPSASSTPPTIFQQTGSNPLRAIGRVEERLSDTGQRITGNHVLVENDRDAEAPMGVIMENAPFIGLMMLAAVSGALGFMKLRKKEYEDDIA